MILDWSSGKKKIANRRAAGLLDAVEPDHLQSGPVDEEREAVAGRTCR